MELVYGARDDARSMWKKNEKQVTAAFILTCFAAFSCRAIPCILVTILCSSLYPSLYGCVLGSAMLTFRWRLFYTAGSIRLSSFFTFMRHYFGGWFAAIPAAFSRAFAVCCAFVPLFGGLVSVVWSLVHDYLFVRRFIGFGSLPVTLLALFWFVRRVLYLPFVNLMLSTSMERRAALPRLLFTRAAPRHNARTLLRRSLAYRASRLRHAGFARLARDAAR